VLVQLNSKSKEEISVILRSLNVSKIIFKRLKDDIVYNHEVDVPLPGSNWKVGHPTADELREAALKEIRSRKPELMEAPWMRLVAEVKDKWGSDDLDGWIVSFNIPSTSPFISIENFWGYGKNFVGAPEQQMHDRSFKQILDMLYYRWLSPTSSGASSHYRLSEKYINSFIQEDHENGGPLSGGKVGELVGVPSEEVLAEWKKKAGDVLNEDSTGFNKCNEDQDENEF
jgi:hypothetical protein